MITEEIEIPASPTTTTTTERVLLITAGIFLFANYLALGTINLTIIQPVFWLHFVVWVLCALAGHWWLNGHLPGRDPLIFALAMFLAGWGLLLIDRLAPIFADRQTIWLILGTSAMLLVASFPHALHWLRTYRYTLLLIGLALLIATIVLGRNPSGVLGAPQLWLGIGSLFFQPSEALKIILVVFLASYLAEQQPLLRAEELSGSHRRLILPPRIIGPILLMWGISIVMLIWQRDLGTAILFFVIFLIMLYTATGSSIILLSGTALILVAALAGYNLFGVVQLRIDVWINPWLEADGRAYQIVQSLMAFANGGIFGEGIGQGLPDFIPVVHSDFIFAALGEEWGLLGIIVLIATISAIVLRGLRIAILHQHHSFRAFLAVGLSMLIAVQSLMIMAGVLKVIPLTGVTLPFMSYGGSSLLVSFILLGLLLRLSSSEN